MKKRIFVYLLVFFLLITSNIVLYEKSDDVSAGPADDFGYYKVVSISNANNSYVIYVNLTKTSGGDINCSGHCQNDFDDVRFYDIDNTTKLDYYIEDYSSGSYALIFIELPSDIETDQKIILYYGDTEATGVSDGDATFTYFEDFDSDPGIDDTGRVGYWRSYWMGNFSLSDGFHVGYELYYDASSTGSYGSCGFFRLSNITSCDTDGDISDNGAKFMVDNYDTDHSPCPGIKVYHSLEDTGNGWTGLSQGVWCHMDSKYLPDSNHSLYRNYSLIDWADDPDNDTDFKYFTVAGKDYGSPSTWTWDSDNEIGKWYDRRSDSSTYLKLWLDDIYVRGYISTEPSISGVGAEKETGDTESPEMEDMTVTINSGCYGPNILVDEEEVEDCSANIFLLAKLNVTDNVEVDTVAFNITFPGGTIQNDSLVHSSGNLYKHDFPFSFVVPDELGTYTYFFWCNDTSDNSNVTEKMNFTLVDTTFPWIQNVVDTPHWNYTDRYINITCDVTDNSTSGVDSVMINITYPNATESNISMVDGPGDTYYLNLNYSDEGLHEYFIWANDTLDNRGSSVPDPLYNFTMYSFQDTVYVDDDYTASTPGWNTTHYDNIPDAMTILNPGGIMNVYNGTYDSGWTLNKSITIRGNGTETNFTYIHFNYVKDTTSVIMENITISGGYGIEFWNTTNSEVKNCYINSGYKKLSFRDSDNNTIHDNTILGGGSFHFRVNGSSCNNTFYNNTGSDSVTCNSVTRDTANNNTYYLNQFIQFWLSGDAKDNVYYFNKCGSGSIGLWGNSGGNNTLYNDTLNMGNWYNDYPGVDLNYDGIGDTPYGEDLYPLMYNVTYLPPNFPPIIGNPIPINGATGISVSTEYLYIVIKDPNGDTFNYTIEDTEGNSATIHDQNNGTQLSAYLLTFGNMPYNTTVTWWVNVTDDTSEDHAFNKTYTFTTELNEPPVITDASPVNGATHIDINLDTVNVLINDSEGDTFDWSIEVNTSDSDTGDDENNGTKNCTLTIPLAYDTIYTFWVNLSDYTGNTTAQNESYSFTTRGPNHPPNISLPSPCDNGKNNISLDLGNVSVYICDPEGDTFNWSIEASTGDIASGFDEGNGTKYCSLTTPLNDTEQYTWWVNITGATFDASTFSLDNQTYNFTAGIITHSEQLLGRLGDLMGMGILMFVIFFVIFLIFMLLQRR